ncbi:MAG: 2Fe-2S iron-sulfur cluster-binding protein, partial [Devosiaceae bacterium]|nr:2Fe-2S iron-sulfur cluster-binding protein [Devosiaceae bacterium]
MIELRSKNGGRIDRDKPVKFSFNGISYSGFEGDTLASALLASGVHFVGRSYKYHRPRGIMSAGNEEPCALVGVDRGWGRFEPNTRATTLELVEGLAAKSQHCWPSLKWDIGELTRLGGPIFSAGFYYKTFMWPRSFWQKIYEPLIRKSAGLGDAPTTPDPDSYASCFAHCDVLVVGGGPAGIVAALNASSGNKRVILCDEQNEFGGDLLGGPQTMIENLLAWDWLAQKLKILRQRKNVILLPRTTGFGYYEQNLLGLCQRLSDHLPSVPNGLPRERLWKVRAKKVVLATGAIERPLVFSGNDRPGIMLAGAAKAYLLRFG